MIKTDQKIKILHGKMDGKKRLDEMATLREQKSKEYYQTRV